MENADWTGVASSAFQGKSLPPLQAADTFAYECGKFVRDKLENRDRPPGNKRPMRKSFKRLIKDDEDKRLVILDQKEIEKFNHDMSLLFVPT